MLGPLRALGNQDLQALSQSEGRGDTKLVLRYHESIAPFLPAKGCTAVHCDTLNKVAQYNEHAARVLRWLGPHMSMCEYWLASP